jgi:hypothetical protein
VSSGALFPIRISEALDKIEALWVALDPEMKDRFFRGDGHLTARVSSPPRVIFEYATGATDSAQKPMHQGQGSLGVRRVQLVAHIWGKGSVGSGFDDTEDRLMAFAAIGAEALNPSYFRLLSEDWTRNQSDRLANGSVVYATFEIVLPLMRLPWELARVQQMPLKQTVEPKQ